MPEPADARADPRDATLRDQGERLVRQDATAARMSAAWLDIVPRVAGFVASGFALRKALGTRLKRDAVLGWLDPAREACERVLAEALLSEIRLTDDAARQLLRMGVPFPLLSRSEGFSEAEGDDADVPGSPGWQRRARNVNEIALRLGKPVFTVEEAERLAFAPFKGAKETKAVRWTTRLKRLTRKVARGVLRDVGQAYSEGWSTDRLVREVAASVGEGEYSARLIAQTELQRVGNAAKDRCFAQFTDTLAAEEWQAAWEGTCVECGLLDGRRFPVGQAPLRPVHPRCPCTLSAVPRTWRELGIDMDEVPVPGRVLRGHKRRPRGETWRTWIRKQPADYQRRILGKGRYDLLKSGRLKLDQVRAPGGGIRTVKKLKELFT